MLKDMPQASPVDAAPPQTAPSDCGEAPSEFKLLYESNDGGLCVFEQKDGRVVAIKGSRLV